MASRSRGINARRALALGCNAAKSDGANAEIGQQKGRCPKGVSAQMALRIVEHIGDSHSMVTPLFDAYSDLLDTL